MSRILRTFVCLLLICCILVNLSPLKAQATGAGVVAGGIVKAASVSIPALWPIVASLAVVGITAYGIESGAFENIANSCYSAFESAGTWINNGMAEILRTEDADGNVQYYVDGGMLEAVRSFCFSENIVTSTLPGAKYYPANSNVFSDPYSFDTYDYPVYRIIFDRKSYTDQLLTVCAVAGATLTRVSSSGTKQTFSPSDNGYAIAVQTGYFDYDYLVNSGVPVVHESTSYSMYSAVINDFLSGTLDGDSEYITNYDVTLGYLPDRDTVLDDETIVTFHPYLSKVLRTRTGGPNGSWDPENDPFKFWFGVHFADTLLDLYQTSQQAQIENPSVVEIPDLQEGTQYEVTVEEDEDGNKKYILNPIYDPGTNPGTGTDPGTGDGSDTDPDTGSGDNTGTDSGNSGNSGNSGSTWKPPSDPTHFKLVDLSKFFPFCIPFDLFDFFKLLNADPVAPSFTWEIQDLSGQTFGLTVDLSQWDSVAQLFRRLQLFLFVCGLAAASRKFIKW